MRKQFTFYESFYSALKRIRKDADRAKAYDAICAYALTGEMPNLEALPDAAAIAFDLIRPTLDSSARKAESGKSGGSKQQANGKQTASKQEANCKQTGREKEGEVEIEGEKEKEIEIENECSIKETNKESMCERPIVLKAAMRPDNQRYYEAQRTEWYG